MNRLAGALVIALVPLPMLGCGEDPVDVEVQVIEELDFAPSLGIDLGSMDYLSSGVYVQELVAGSGAQVTYGSTPTVTYTGWLYDGTEFDSGTFSFLMGNNNVILGLEDAMLGALVGSTRLMVIPPRRGYAGQTVQTNTTTIPPWSVLVFEVTIDDVEPAP